MNLSCWTTWTILLSMATMQQAIGNDKLSSEDQCHGPGNKERHCTSKRETRDCEQLASRLDCAFPIDACVDAFVSRIQPRSIHWRQDVIIEDMMKEYNLDVIIQIPTKINTRVAKMLLYAHPDALISVIPGPGPLHVDTDRVFTTLRSGGGADTLLRKARSLSPGPCLIWIDATGSGTDGASLLTSSLLVADKKRKDVIIIDGATSIVKDIHKRMCSVHDAWHMYTEDHVLVLTSSAPGGGNPDKLPPLPEFISDSHSDVCFDKISIKTDIVVFTKHRPMQMFAFLESLISKVTGINTVWVIEYASDAFKDGYAFVYGHFASDLDIRRVLQKRGEFGHALSDVLEKMTAQYVVLAVDEDVWLRKLDLRRASCLLDMGKGDIATFQLRLGKNIHTYDTIRGKKHRFRPLARDPEVILYYPKRLPYDFGYVLNLDGTLASKQNLLNDIGPWLLDIAHPGHLENTWMQFNQHTRCRQWQLMYTASRIVNNVLSDGRVLQQASASADSLRLLSLLMEKKVKVDIESFTKANVSPTQCHLDAPVQFIQIENNI